MSARRRFRPSLTTTAAVLLAGLAAGTASAQAVFFVGTQLVSPVPGTPVLRGTRLLARLASIGGASATNPYLLKIEPGVYDLRMRTLAMKPFVDVEGSGEAVTIGGGTVERSGTLGR